MLGIEIDEEKPRGQQDVHKVLRSGERRSRSETTSIPFQLLEVMDREVVEGG